MPTEEVNTTNRKTQEISRDSIMSSSRAATARGVMAVLTAIQDMPQEQQVVTSACIFALFAEHFDYAASPTELLNLADRLMRDAEGYRTEFAAARQYMAHEWA